jgi:hypothetical protein
LDIFIGPFYRRDPFSLVILQIDRVASISVFGGIYILRHLARQISCPVPLLKTLTINLISNDPPTIGGVLFGGSVPSLCTLNLSGVTPHIPWENLPNLTTFTLHHVPGGAISVTRLLNFFENAPLLREIEFRYSLPNSSDAPPKRVVPLPSLKNLKIFADLQPSSILLNHLFIPAGASLHLEFVIKGARSLRNHLPESPANLQNASGITSVSLDHGEVDATILLDGLSGRLSMRGYQEQLSWTSPSVIFKCLGYFDLSRAGDWHRR